VTKEESRAVLFALDLVDRLGAEYGFDPAELVNPRTGRPFGAFIARMRRTMLRVDAYCLDEPSGLDDPEVTGFAIRGGSLNYGHPSRG
jgi:hypothetical protein